MPRPPKPSQLQLHRAIEGGQLGGVGSGVSPRTALAVGLKVDVDALPANLVEQLKAGQVNLDDPAVTLALLKLKAVVGVTGFFNQQGTLRAVGIQCAGNQLTALLHNHITGAAVLLRQCISTS